MQLEGTTAIVTGGAVRIGRALALALADRGANIVLHYGHSENEAQETAHEIEKRGVQVLTVQADFGDSEAAARKVIETAFAECDYVGILINSAAIFESATLAETTNEIWDRHHAINLKTPFFLCKEFAAHFQKSNATNGHILNIVDWRATHPQGGTAHLAYTMAKSGLAALTEALAVELGPAIQVNGIAPGAILPPPGEEDGVFQQRAKHNPLMRVGSPDDIVEAALYLLESGFVTGEILHINGGEHFTA
ncbi:MAG: SDR family oxidoreductase [Planctomycetaceae bacterium]|nr:SDR family oxidoreductase [Planctomycetaceae bacterium]